MKDPTVEDPAAYLAAREKRVVRPAVGWLLGPELVGQLKKIVRQRSDPRDWMPYFKGSVHDECWKHDGKLVSTIDGGRLEGVGVDALDVVSQSATQNAQSAERVVPMEGPADLEERDVWFDYVADMGDAGESMYAVAYATMVGFDGKRAVGATLEPATWEDGGSVGALPRGQFVFIGGDTAYHVADAATLKSRVEEPFRWAFYDARIAKHIPKFHAIADRTRRIYGIPGNHDWYDNLRGFSLVFRLGSASRDEQESATNPIQLPELERVQLASYCAIQLPYGWQLWGLDLDSPIDRRQRDYFKSLPKPERLIVATPSPAIVFGASIPDEDKHRKALAQLEIPVPELPLGAVVPKLRLDISGDVHHYARYFPTPTVSHYGSVVSGLGGAFHHPTFTRASATEQRVEPQCEYPTCRESLDRLGNELLDPGSTWYGSWARVVPFVLTLLVGFASLYSAGGSWLYHHVIAWSPWHDLAPLETGQALMHATCALGVFAVACIGVWRGWKFGGRVFKRQIDHPGVQQNIVELVKEGRIRSLLSRERSYWYAWAIAILFASPFCLYPLWGPDASRLDIATVIIVFVLPVLGAVVGWKVGAKHLRVGLKARVAFAGLVHAAAHVVTAIVFANLVRGTPQSILSVVGAFAIAAVPLAFVRPLFKAQSRWCILPLALIALCVFAASLGLIAYASGGWVVARLDHWYFDAARMIGVALASMLFGTTWFIWYLAITCRLNAHNNEAGGAARITKYRQMIRFHVHRDGITGYVISIENTNKELAPRTGGENLAYRLVDVFTVGNPSEGRGNV